MADAQERPTVKNPTIRRRYEDAGIEIVAAIKRDYLPEMDPNDGGQILVWILDLAQQVAEVEAGRVGGAAPSARAHPNCVIGQYCHRHGFIHGAEAEELRERFEKLIPFLRPHAREQVQHLLDDVDARDSFAFCEAGKEVLPIGKAEARSHPEALEDLAFRASRIFRGFNHESINGVVCSMPDGGLDTPPHRTWCAGCQRLWRDLYRLAQDLAGLDAAGRAEPVHRCACCGVRWEGVPGAAYCGACHREALAARIEHWPAGQSAAGRAERPAPPPPINPLLSTPHEFRESPEEQWKGYCMACGQTFANKVHSVAKDQRFVDALRDTFREQEAIALLRRWAYPGVNLPWDETKAFLARVDAAPAGETK